jgi:hypothetical protein
MRKRPILTALLSAAVVATPAMARKAPELTPMELQSLQSREYQTSKDQVFSSIVSVFQDLGYQINSADIASGLITAGSANKNKTGFFEAIAGMRSSGGSRVTAFVETMPSGLTRARLNFMNTKNSSSMYGSSSAKDTAVLDPKTYQVAFEHIEEALFERGALTKTAPPAQTAVSPPAQTATVAPSSSQAGASTASASSGKTAPQAAPKWVPLQQAQTPQATAQPQ